MKRAIWVNGTSNGSTCDTKIFFSSEDTSLNQLKTKIAT